MKTISDLGVIGSLGSGAFGFVKLVKLKGCEGKAFALKGIFKYLKAAKSEAFILCNTLRYECAKPIQSRPV